MRAAMRFGHDGNYGDSGGGADGLGAELGEECFALRVGERGYHLHELRCACKAILTARCRLERVEVHVLALVREVHHGVHDLRDCSNTRFFLAQAVCLVAALARPWSLPRLRHRRHRHEKTQTRVPLRDFSSAMAISQTLLFPLEIN